MREVAALICWNGPKSSLGITDGNTTSWLTCLQEVKTDNQCNNLLEEAVQPCRYVAPTRWIWQSCHMSLDEIGLWARIIFVEFKNVTKGTNTVLPQELSLAVKRCGIAITLESVAKTQENIIG